MGDSVVIWFLAHIPEGSTGGVARSVHTLMQGMRKRGHSAYIVYAHEREQYLMYALRCAIRFVFCFSRPNWICARSTDGVFCTLIIRLLHIKTRMALYSHGWEENAYTAERRQLKIWGASTGIFARLIRFPLLRYAARKSHCLFTGTLHEALYLKQQFPHTRIVVTPNGVNLPLTPCWIPQADEPAKRVPDCIGWIGVDTWKKDLPYALAVVAEVRKLNPALRLIIAGMSAAQVKARAPERYAESWVEARGTVDADAMMKVYAECPYILSTSRFEGGRAYALLEAMAQGCMVFATVLPSTTEFVRHEQSGYLLAGNAAAVDAQLLAACMQKNDSAVRLSAFSCAKHHSIDRQLRRFERALL